MLRITWRKAGNPSSVYLRIAIVIINYLEGKIHKKSLTSIQNSEIIVREKVEKL